MVLKTLYESKHISSNLLVIKSPEGLSISTSLLDSANEQFPFDWEPI